MKIRFLPVCILLALLLTGCGHAAPETTAPTLPETQAAATQPTQTSQPETLPTETQPAEEHFLLTFAGDCTFGSNPTNYYAESGFIKTVGDDYAYPFANVIDYFAGDEFSMVNLEGPLCDEGNPVQKKHVFHGPTAYVNCLTENSIEAVTVANNHSMDYSHNGLLATTKYLKQEDMNFAGIGENLSDASAPVYVEGENIRAAVIAATSSFHESWAAGNQRLDMKGRPGVNPLHFQNKFHVTQEYYDMLQKLAGRRDRHQRPAELGCEGRLCRGTRGQLQIRRP